MILVCYGTRPEIIKLAPVIDELKARGLPFKTVFTGQHKDLYLQFKNAVPKPDYCLEMQASRTLSDTMAAIIVYLDQILAKGEVKLLIVQGDTASTFACALSAFNQKVAIGHVEAGLRTYNLASPFPEEGYRQMISRIATLHWAPTDNALTNLKKEGMSHARMTGNTVMDSCMATHYPISYSNKVLVTLHRRENFGERMIKLFNEIEELAYRHPELEVLFPMHPNPQVRMHKDIFKKVQVIEPLEYLDTLKLISEAKFIISDSGGLQEECVAFRKKILICRENTERPESIEVGIGKIVNTDILANYRWAYDEPEWIGVNPYGEGNARKAIVNHIVEYFDL